MDINVISARGSTYQVMLIMSLQEFAGYDSSFVWSGNDCGKISFLVFSYLREISEQSYIYNSFIWNKIFRFESLGDFLERPASHHLSFNSSIRIQNYDLIAVSTKFLFNTWNNFIHVHVVSRFCFQVVHDFEFYFKNSVVMISKDYKRMVKWLKLSTSR